MKPFEIALREYGTKEIVGNLHNKEVLKYYAELGHGYIKDDETAWCSAFVGYCLEKAKMVSTKKLNARSYLTWGVETKTPELGDIVVFWRGIKTGWEGHVGFFVRYSEDGQSIFTLSGNQNNEVNISAHPTSQLLSFRKVPTISIKDTEAQTLLQQVSNFLKKYE